MEARITRVLLIIADFFLANELIIYPVNSSCPNSIRVNPLNQFHPRSCFIQNDE